MKFIKHAFKKKYKIQKKTKKKGKGKTKRVGHTVLEPAYQNKASSELEHVEDRETNLHATRCRGVISINF